MVRKFKKCFITGITGAGGSYLAEHILKKEHYVLMKEYFNKVEIKHYHLFTLLAVPIRNTFLFKPAMVVLEALDAIFLKIPGIRWQAWHAICILSEPKK